MAHSGASIDPDRPYPMHRPRLGHAVIINNVAEEHEGSLRDMEAMQAAYKSVGFDVKVHLNCDDQQMRKVKKWIMNDDNHRDSNCFAMTIICHGSEKGDLLDKDKRRSWDTEFLIAELSDVETLQGKPKILTIQACRGRQMGDGRTVPGADTLVNDDTESTNILPDKADMFITFATVPGYRAHAGNDDTGSIYLQSFAKYLTQEYKKRPLDKILKMVRQEMVAQKHGLSGMRICSEERNTLIYDVMFSEFHKLSISSEKFSQDPVPLTLTHLSTHDTPTVSEGPNGNETLDVKAMLTDLDPVPLTLTHLSTHDTPLCFWGYTRMSAGPAQNTVVLWRKKSKDSGHEFLLYDVAGERVKLQKTYRPLCEHNDTIYMLPVTVKGKRLIAVSCWYCQTIRLWDIQSGEVTIAFHDKWFCPRMMCHGREGVIYCVNAVKGENLILELDCATHQFTLKQTFPYSLSGYNGLTYDPVNHIVVMSNTHDKLIHGYSCSTGKLVWSREITGVNVKPFGLVYSEKHKVIIVCAHTQIVVLNPVNREVLKIVERKNKDHLLIEACIINDTLAVLMFDNPSQIKLLFYSMK